MHIRLTTRERGEINWLAKHLDLNESETIRYMIRIMKVLYGDQVSLGDVLGSSILLKQAGVAIREQVKDK
jgi:hypothetical protein